MFFGRTFFALLALGIGATQARAGELSCPNYLASVHAFDSTVNGFVNRNLEWKEPVADLISLRPGNAREIQSVFESIPSKLAKDFKTDDWNMLAGLVDAAYANEHALALRELPDLTKNQPLWKSLKSAYGDRAVGSSRDYFKRITSADEGVVHAAKRDFTVLKEMYGETLDKTRETLTSIRQYKKLSNTQLASYSSPEAVVKDVESMIDSYKTIFPKGSGSDYDRGLASMREALTPAKLEDLKAHGQSLTLKDLVQSHFGSADTQATSAIRGVFRKGSELTDAAIEGRARSLWSTSLERAKACVGKPSSCITDALVNRIGSSFKCLAGSPVGMRDLGLGLAFFAGASLTVNHNAGMKEFPWEDWANTLIWATVGAEAGCRSVHKPSIPFGSEISSIMIKGRRVSAFSAKKYLENYKKFFKIAALSSATYIGFKGFFDNVLDRDKKMDIEEAIARYPFLVLYDGIWGPFKTIYGTVPLRYQFIPWLSKKGSKFLLDMGLNGRVTSPIVQELGWNILLHKVGWGTYSAFEWKEFKKQILNRTDKFVRVSLGKDDSDGDAKTVRIRDLPNSTDKAWVKKSLDRLGLKEDEVELIVAPDESGNPKIVDLTLSPEALEDLSERMLAADKSEAEAASADTQPTPADKP